MSRLPIFSLVKIILERKTSFGFLMGAIGSFSFSMAVILGTIGLMDGFELTLKKALHNSNGDIKVSNRKGFYLDDEDLVEKFNIIDPVSYTNILNIQSFFVSESGSKGVLLKGIEKTSFKEVSSLDLDKLDKGVYIGSELAQKYDLKVGGFAVFAFASDKEENQGNAQLFSFPIEGIVKHGVYEKDLRVVYLKKELLAKSLGYKIQSSNTSLIKIDSFENIEDKVEELNAVLPNAFKVEPYWSEFEVLLDAVKVEKFSISLILQLIVIVAILNIAAFIIYISNKKSQDFFMLRALGLDFSSFQKFWYLLLTSIWFISLLVSIVLIAIFKFIIEELPFLKIPGDIYVLSDLKVIVDLQDYIYVFGMSLLWVLILGFITVSLQKRKSLVSGLRQEFS